MPLLQRLEVWSDLQCAGGTRLAVTPLDHVTRCVTTTRRTREDDGLLELSKDAASASSMDTGRVLRLLFADGTFDEWRIRQLDDTSRASRMVRVVVQSPLYDLNVGAAMITETVAGAVDFSVEWKALTPSEVLAAILAFAPTYFAVGTVTPTIPVNLTSDAWMPLRAVRELVAAVNAQGVMCEVDYRRNGTTGYYVDLVTTIGASAPVVDVRTAKNLLSTARTRDRTKYATEIVPYGASRSGARATMARAYLEVTAKSGATLTVQAPVTGGSVIAFTGQYDGLYLVDDANAKQVISNTTATTFDVASATNVTAGRWYRLALDSSGKELVRMRKAPATAGPVRPVESSGLDDTTNLLSNPGMRVWTGASSAPPDGWTTTGVGTLTRTTTSGLWLYGGKSCRVQSTSMFLYSPAFSVYVPTYATSVTLSAWVYVTTASTGDVRFVVDGTLQNQVAFSTLPTGEWRRVDYTHSMAGLTGAVRSFQVYAGGGTSDFYYDAAQISFTSDARAFVEGSNATRLLTRANQELVNYGTAVPTTYAIALADADVADPSLVQLGASASVRDTDLGVTTTARLIELAVDWKNSYASEITVSTQSLDLVSTLSGIASV